MAAEMLDLEDQEHRNDARAGVLAMTVANVMGAKRRDGRPWEPAHFFTRLREAPVKRGWRAAKERLLMYFGHANLALAAGVKPARPRKGR